MGPLSIYGPYAWLIPEEFWAKPKRDFTYSVEFVTPNQLAASASRTQTVGINRDSHFVAIRMVATVTNTDNTTFVDTPAILVNVKDSGSGFDLMDKPVPFISLFHRGSSGDGKERYLTLPRIFDPGSTISVTLENQDATARHVRIAFDGFRVWGG